MTAGGSTERPLGGRRIVVTRRPEQSEWLCARLRELGAAVIELPLIEIALPEDTALLDHALRGLDRYDWVVFTSANAVRSVRRRMEVLGIASEALGSRKIASVGPATSSALGESFPGAEVALEPAMHDAESMLGELAGRASGRRFLLPVSDRARGVLAEGLLRAGAEVDLAVAYRTVAPAGLAQRVRDALREGADAVTFASPSAVENLVAAAVEVVPRIKAAVIGPVTEAACRRAGIEVLVAAAPATAEGLAAALERRLSRASP